MGEVSPRIGGSTQRQALNCSRLSRAGRAADRGAVLSPRGGRALCTGRLTRVQVDRSQEPENRRREKWWVFFSRMRASMGQQIKPAGGELSGRVRQPEKRRRRPVARMAVT